MSEKHINMSGNIATVLYTTLPPSSEAIIIMAFVYNTEGGGRWCVKESGVEVYIKGCVSIIHSDT